MEKPLNSPVPNNECFLSALRQEDFLTSLCPKSLTNNDKVSKDSDNLSKPSGLQSNFYLNKNSNSQSKEINIDNGSNLSFGQGNSPKLDKSGSILKEQSCDTTSTDIPSRPFRSFAKSDQHSECSSKKKICKSLEGSCNSDSKNVSLCLVSKDSINPTLSDQQPYSKASLSPSFSHTCQSPSTNKLERYKKTQDALQGSGLLEITMKTAELIKQNRRLQKDLENFKKESAAFMQSVLNNPENKLYREALLISSSSSSKSKQ